MDLQQAISREILSQLRLSRLMRVLEPKFQAQLANYLARHLAEVFDIRRRRGSDDGWDDSGIGDASPIVGADDPLRYSVGVIVRDGQ